MQIMANIPEVVHRERFVRRVSAAGSITFVAGDDGWACVPFRQDTSRDVVLFWSSAVEAHKWADVVATAPSIHEIKLPVLLGEVLPMLRDRRCLIGFDWSSDPTDPILDPADLMERLWRERSENFLTKVREGDAVWVLESAAGPAFLPSKRGGGKEFLPVWASRDEAQFNCVGTWTVKRPISVSLAVFRERYLPFIEQRGWFIGPQPMAGVECREMTTAEFLMRAFPAAETLSRLRAVS
jgi:hypothetical protein